MSTALITGASSGLGHEAIRFIAARGNNDIVLGGRDSPKMQTLAAELRRLDNVKVTVLPLDVSSLESVEEAAVRFKQLVSSGQTGPLSTLILNAGMQSLTAPEYSVDGYEMTFATNCLGHFLLLNLLLDEIEDGGRVVWTSSGTHDPDTADGKLVGKAVAPDAEMLATTGKGGKPLPGGVRYTTSKLCVLLYSYELARRLRTAGRNVASIAYDPGYVPETGLGRGAPRVMQWMSKTAAFKTLFGLFGGTLGDLAFSGAGLGRVAVDEEYDGASGKYFQSKNFTLHEATSSRASRDLQSAKRLWTDSARLVHLNSPDVYDFGDREKRSINAVEATSTALPSVAQ